MARKYRHMDIVCKYTAAGVYFQPLILEAYRGVNSEIITIFPKIAKLGIAHIGKNSATILVDLLSKLSMVLVRAAFKNIYRRRRSLNRTEAMPLIAFLYGTRLAEPPDL